MDKLKKQREELLGKAKALVQERETADRALTDSDRTQLKGWYSEVESLDGLLAQADADRHLVDRVKAKLPDHASGELPLTKSLNEPQVRALAQRLAVKSLDKDSSAGSDSTYEKALTLADATEVLVTELVVQPWRPRGLLDVIPLVPLSSPTFKFARQTTRVNNAAPVAEGALKPTSTLGLVSVESSLRVVAHLSEPVDKYLLTDVAALADFVGFELQNGLLDTVERQVLVGTGVAPQLSGIASVSGVQLQGFDTDVVTTVRQGITKLEALGYRPASVVLRPEDWEAVELSQTNGSGEYVLAASPVDRAAQKLWGVPVVLSSGLAVGTGQLLAQDSLKLYTDGRVAVDWDTSGDLFKHNQVQLRVESRFELAVTRPLGVVSLDTTP